MDKNKLNLISWERATSPKVLGGMGLRDHLTVKRTMSAKRILPLINKADFLWVHILKAKYGDLKP